MKEVIVCTCNYGDLIVFMKSDLGEIEPFTNGMITLDMVLAYLNSVHGFNGEIGLVTVRGMTDQDLQSSLSAMATSSQKGLIIIDIKQIPSLIVKALAEGIQDKAYATWVS